MRSKRTGALLRAHAACWVIAVLATAAQAMPGDLDPTFGDGGKLRLRVSRRGDAANALVVQPDGKIVAAGYVAHGEGSEIDAVVVRLLPDGAVDASFGTAGKVVLRPRRRPASAEGVALQPDGRIVVAGSVHSGRNRSRFFVARLMADGSLDASFGEKGVVTTGFEGVSALADTLLLTRDGKILVGGGAYPSRDAGEFTIALARYLVNGRLDPAFARRGRLRLAGLGPVDGLAEQADGAVVAALVGKFAAARFLASGSLDPTFGGSGVVAADFGGIGGSAKAVAIAADRTILLGGYAYPPPFGVFTDFALQRYLPDGTLDPTFGLGGTALTPISRDTDWGLAMTLQPDGRIILAGLTYAGFPLRGTRFALARYRSDGTLDPSFGRGGVVLTGFGVDRDAEVTGLALQGNDRIVAAGFAVGSDNGRSDFAFVRLER